MISTTHASTSRAYPPVHRLTTWAQWLVFAGVVVAIVGATMPTAAEGLQGKGYDVHWWHAATANAIGVAMLLALSRPVWRALDAVPFAPGRRWRNGATRLVIAALYSVVDGTWGYAANIFVVWLYGIDRRILSEPHSQWTTQVTSAMFGFAILLIAHTILQRSHEIRQREALERSLALTRLQALSLELQPHFLFNTLNGIAALVRSDSRRAERMLIRLSDLLRITLDAGTHGEIPLHRELEHLDLYLDLQSMRFGPRLTVSRDVDPATLGARVPSMLLQPLVENALTHGIAPRLGPGRLEVMARREGETLVLRVRDDGVGLPAEAQRRERTGVGTTRARLSAMFDGGHAFTLAPAEGGGTAAEVRIPFSPMEAV